ncbi:hypothetical protein MMC09_004681 [Bachmanniomyces sp. S44760]|nr:hypothetical protein [Bachmanniomyces sp. S44760]
MVSAKVSGGMTINSDKGKDTSMEEITYAMPGYLLLVSRRKSLQVLDLGLRIRSAIDDQDRGKRDTHSSNGMARSGDKIAITALQCARTYGSVGPQEEVDVARDDIARDAKAGDEVRLILITVRVSGSMTGGYSHDPGAGGVQPGVSA